MREEIKINFLLVQNINFGRPVTAIEADVQCLGDILSPDPAVTK
jgi:hypothetical protein